MNLWTKSYGATIQLKATEQYFPVVLFIMLHKVVLTTELVDEVLKCNHSNEATKQYFPVVLLTSAERSNCRFLFKN